MIERADTPGLKNVTGGRFYTYALEMVEKGLTLEAPLERKVTHEQIMLLGDKRAISIDYHDTSFNEEGKVAQSYTVLRSAFDEWFAGKAEELGAIVACGIKVDDLITKNGKIVGVIAGEDEMYADVVVAADGVNAFIAQKAGLIGDIEGHAVGVGIKEVIELPAKIIEERFILSKDEGAARMILGCTEGIHGGGFLYTNSDSLSLGCVLTPQEVVNHGKSVHAIFQDMKMHPTIYPLIEGGETVEYEAHLVSELGYRGIPKKLYRDGFLIIGESAGFVINTGYSIRGIDLAILSGIAAAKAIIATNDPAMVGQTYMNQLEMTKLIASMKAVDGYFDMLEIPRIFSAYPKLATDVFGQLYRMEGEVPISMKKEVLRLIKANGLSIWQLMKDGFKGVRSI